MKRRILSIMLAICMVLTLMPQAAFAAAGTSSTPSVSAYATKDQLMDGTFAPDSSGNAANIGKIVFGKNSSGKAQEWYVLGKDIFGTEENTTIFAASPIKEKQRFNETKMNRYEKSALIAALWEMATDTSYFTTAEQGMMNTTLVQTEDTENKNRLYTTTEKLYALTADSYGTDVQIIKAGSYNQIKLSMKCYWNSGNDAFWLRSPCKDAEGSGYLDNAIMAAQYGNSVIGAFIVGFAGITECPVQPAGNLDLSNVLFASAATAASSAETMYDIIASGTAMTLRLDGSGKNIGTATYNAATGDVKAAKGSRTGNVSLVVQGNDGTNDWYYSEKIAENETVNTDDIKSALQLSSIDLSSCRIWLETTDSDGMIYAVNAEKEIEKINTTYADKEQLMNAFGPYGSGTAANIGKIVFGKNSSRDPQEWYILGKDTGVAGDNTVLFAASPIVPQQVYDGTYADLDDKGGEKTKTVADLGSDCSYSAAAPTEVYLNHYGASALRDKLQAIATENFTAAERGLMNATTVTTKDTRIDKNYTTTDKLYALAADGFGTDVRIIKAGSNNQIALAAGSYWNDEKVGFWLRTSGDNINNPPLHDSCFVLYADSGLHVAYHLVPAAVSVQPASNLNLSNVLFASAATAATFENPEISGTIASGTAMTLRLDGSSKNIGAAIYNAAAGDIQVTRGGTSLPVTLMVQGNDGVNNWYYSKYIEYGYDKTKLVNVSDIKTALNLTSDIDLSSCKIWLEAYSDPADRGNGMIYAVDADEEMETINTTYATKEQLMNSFSPYNDGSAANIGKLVFGKNGKGQAQEWYILGRDNGVTGENTAIFAASHIEEDQRFSSDTGNKTYNGAEVYANHYGASDLRAALKAMTDGADTTYFSANEKSIMNPTTVTTKDTKNGTTYTTSDKLYALTADGTGIGFQTIKAGTNDNIVLHEATYWASGWDFWLRSPDPDAERNSYALVADPGSMTESEGVSYGDNWIRPAANLNLTNVLFASSAEPTSDGIAAGTIPSDKAMKLRMDGSNANIGTVRYDAGNGVIVASANFLSGIFANEDPTYLVVQGSDETGDWYFSKRLYLTFGGDTVSAAQIMAATGAADVNLADCKIWIERTTSIYGITFAVPATETSISVTTISAVELTGMEPTAGQAFPAKASCSTTGVSTGNPDITYTTAEGAPVTGTADWETTYKATVTIGTLNYNEYQYVFDKEVTATVDGQQLSESLSPNADGTLTITREFKTKKNAGVTGITPSVPEGNLFTKYYGYDGYVALPTDGSELGKQAAVTILDRNENTTKNETVNVTWTVANDGDAGYDKTPEATNTFRWTIPASALADYDITGCPGYDAASGTISGTVSIKNKAAAPVTITGTDSSVIYTSTAIDVSQYFTIDANAGTPTYSLLTGAEGGTGEGMLNGSNLTVTRIGTFKVKVKTAANGIYATGEESITLTVNKKDVSITAQAQSIQWGNPISQSAYDVSENGIAAGDRIAEITLTPSTTELTEEGTISISGVKIENTAGRDVTGNYDITLAEGTLTIAHNTSLAPDRIDAVKIKKSYLTGNTVNVDDITVTAYYADGFSEEVTDFTTNAAELDMWRAGGKTLTVSYSRNGQTRTADIEITVTAISMNSSTEQNPIIENDEENAKTNADLSGTTTTSGGTTTATIDQAAGEEIVDKAVANKSEEIVIDATANTTTAADSTVIAQVGIPTDTLGAIAEKTNADVTVKTDVAEVKMDNAVAGAVAKQAAGDTVQLIVEKVAETAEKVEFQLKVVCSDGTVIHDFKGGSVSVTVDIPETMAEKKIVCVYIDDSGRMSKVKGQKNADGTYTFTTGHFSAYALMTAEEADAAIAAQKEEIRNIDITLRSKQVKMKDGKKAIKLTWTTGSDVDFDGVEIYRSTKRYSGYGKTPIFTTEKDAYYNTAIKAGTKYYYKVRGYVTIDGEKVYTDWSTKAWRTVK
ncbi:MAG: DUF6273 domain-containing protein [Anaerovoracaceae bacterium]|nr:DUF6273 domain-containing protein [Anaerovoracaceae bacterium]